MAEEDETLVILDHMGRPIGRADRSLSNTTGLWHLCAQLWLVVHQVPLGDSQVVFQRRSASKRVNPGKLDVSAAGHVASGSTAEETALRECAEELGLNIAIKDLRYIGRRVDMYEGPNVLSRVFADVFMTCVEPAQFRPRFDRDELDGVVLIPLDTLLDFEFEMADHCRATLCRYAPRGDQLEFEEIEVARADFLPRYDWYYRKVAENARRLLRGQPPLGI